MPLREKAVFLDRDGVINEDTGYVDSPDLVKLMPGAAGAVAALRRAGFLIVVITNQSGIGRGYYGEDEFAAVNGRIRQLLRDEGGDIDAVYHCPHRPDEGCSCRKPEPGMLLQAMDDLGIDPGRSFFVGDSLGDMAAGRVAGIGRCFLVSDHRHAGEVENGNFPGIVPDEVFEDLAGASAAILREAG